MLDGWGQELEVLLACLDEHGATTSPAGARMMRVPAFQHAAAKAGFPFPNCRLGRRRESSVAVAYIHPGRILRNR